MAGKISQRQEQFLSTPSARRATVWAFQLPCTYHRISIHALREEGDPQAAIAVHK